MTAGAVDNLALHQAQSSGANEFQFRSDGFTHPINLHEAFRCSTDDLGKAAEFCDQGLGQRFCIATFDGAK